MNPVATAPVGRTFVLGSAGTDTPPAAPDDAGFLEVLDAETGRAGTRLDDDRADTVATDRRRTGPGNDPQPPRRLRRTSFERTQGFGSRHTGDTPPGTSASHHDDPEAPGTPPSEDRTPGGCPVTAAGLTPVGSAATPPPASDPVPAVGTAAAVEPVETAPASGGHVAPPARRVAAVPTAEASSPERVASTGDAPAPARVPAVTVSVAVRHHGLGDAAAPAPEGAAAPAPSAPVPSAPALPAAPASPPVARPVSVADETDATVWPQTADHELEQAAAAGTTPASAVAPEADAARGDAGSGARAEAPDGPEARRDTAAGSQAGGYRPDASPAPPAGAGAPRQVADGLPGATPVPAARPLTTEPDDLLGRAELNRLAGAGQRLDVELDTVNLGRVRVEAVDHRGALSIQIHTDRPDARSVLDQQLGGLHAELADRGGSEPDRPADGRTTPRHPAGPATRGPDVSVPIARRPLVTPDRGVDLYA